MSIDPLWREGHLPPHMPFRGTLPNGWRAAIAAMRTAALKATSTDERELADVAELDEHTR